MKFAAVAAASLLAASLFVASLGVAGAAHAGAPDPASLAGRTEVTPLAVVAAPAPPPGPTYAPAKAADQRDDQFVCKSEAVLGSRMPVRRCHTVKEIRDRSQDDQDMVARAQANLGIRSR